MTLDIALRAWMCPCELEFSGVQQSKADAGSVQLTGWGTRGERQKLKD